MKIVIIGGVAGGATAAARLRRLDEDLEIIMFEKDEYVAFANCGLPYYIGEVITERDKLLVQTVEGLSSRYNLDIRNFSEVTKINPQEKSVKVFNHQTKETYYETYDKLIYTPGASPIVPKFLSKEVNNAFTLRNIPDTDKIYNFISEKSPQNAVVIGAGFIGVEMAENLAERGLNVTLLDLADHILKTFDYEMACELEIELKEHGINVMTSTTVSKVEQKHVILDNGQKISTDLTILALGVMPNSKLAKEAGINTSSRGGVVVNEKFETNIGDIYAIGDVISVNHIITNEQTMVPLAAPANRQARLLADILVGRDVSYKGALGTSVIKVFDKTAAATGLTEKQAFDLGIACDSVVVHRNNHANYYPGASNITIKLVYNRDYKILGAQAIGIAGVEKRIDVIATAIKANLSLADLEDLELSYAPPFSSAKDPVNIAGYVATNVLNDNLGMFKYHEVEKLTLENNFMLDVRDEEEFSLYAIEKFVNIPVNELRTRLDELPNFDTPIYITCQVGLRGYLAQKILLNLGYKKVYNLSGGIKLYRTVKKNQQASLINFSSGGLESEINVEVLDARGLQCPGPITQTFEKMESLNAKDQLKVLVTDNGFCEDITAWAKKCGHELNYIKKQSDGSYEALLTKNFVEGCRIDNVVNEKDQGTIVMFSGDLDKALATMIIAQGAQAMGKQMTIFFTFWGLNVLRKDEFTIVDKSFFEKIFGFMMPRGARKLALSKMHMLGMGSAMIKSRMKDKNVNSLPEMIKQAQAMGVKFIACTMSMDLMGIKEEELIEGIEFAGVAKYVGESSGADLTLFI